MGQCASQLVLPTGPGQNKKIPGSQRILAFNQDRSRGLRRPSLSAQFATFHNICKTSTKHRHNIAQQHCTSLHYITQHYIGKTLHSGQEEQTGNEQFLDFCISTNPKIQNQKMVQIQSFTVCTEAKYMCLNFISWSHKMGFAPESYPQCIPSHPIPSHPNEAKFLERTITGILYMPNSNCHKGTSN